MMTTATSPLTQSRPHAWSALPERARPGSGLTTRLLSVGEQAAVQDYVCATVSMDEAMFFLDPLQRHGVVRPQTHYWGAYDQRARLVGVMLLQGQEGNVVWSAPAVPSCFAELLRQEPQRLRMSGPASLAAVFLRQFTEAELSRRQHGTTCVLTPSHLRPVPYRPVRRATAADVEAILALEQRVLLYDQGQHLETAARRAVIAQRLAAYSVYLVEVEERAVAIAYTDVEIPAAAHVCEVATDPAYRQQGLGTACVAALCGDLLRRVECVFLTYANENTPAARAYHNIGFLPCAARQRACLTLNVRQPVRLAA